MSAQAIGAITAFAAGGLMWFGALGWLAGGAVIADLVWASGLAACF